MSGNRFRYIAPTVLVFLAAVRLNIMVRNPWDSFTFLPRPEFLNVQERSLMTLHCPFASPFACEAMMRLFSRIVAIAAVPAWMGIHMDPAAAQTFDERWSIIPKAHAEPAPEIPNQTRQNPLEQHPTAEPTRRQEDRSAPRSSNRVFSGKASYYAYPTGKTASGSSFNRDSL